MNETTQIIFSAFGGSRAYGLETPSSDYDKRGVYVNSVPKNILGLGRNEVKTGQNEETDEVFYEVRKFFELLKNGNTGALELLFTEKGIFSKSEQFVEIQKHKKDFIDTDKMFRCLSGYMLGEHRLANGERTGRLGGKRKEAIDKYGFSPKNYVQLFRLCECGITLFNNGTFPVNMRDHDPSFCQELLRIKTCPQEFSKEQLNEMYVFAEQKLKNAYENRKVHLVFNEDFANELLRKIYLPYLLK